MEAKKESILDAIFKDDETLDYGDEDVDMTDAFEPDGGDEGGLSESGGGGSEQLRSIQSAGKKKKKKKNKKKRKNNCGSAPNITDINRFVIDACRRLKERKSYLVWNAVGCLGVSAVSDLVKEVDAIQNCGGQRTADGKRMRFGGGILWNILKTREPKAYKEIMAKGKEFEKQLCQPKKKQKLNMNESEAPQKAQAPSEAAEGEALSNSEHMLEAHQNLEHSHKERTSVQERTRVPVSYDDLFEEGEIHE